MSENTDKCLMIFLTRMDVPKKNSPLDEFADTFSEAKNKEQIFESFEEKFFSILTIHGYLDKFSDDKVNLDETKTLESIKKALTEEEVNLKNFSSVKIACHHNDRDFINGLQEELKGDKNFGNLDIEVVEYTERGNKTKKDDWIREWAGKSFPVDKFKIPDSKRRIVNGVIHETIKTFTPLLFDLEHFASYVKEITEAHSEKNFSEQAKDIPERAALIFEREELTKLWEEATGKLHEVAGSSQNLLQSFGELDGLLKKLSEELLRQEQKEPEK